MAGPAAAFVSAEQQTWEAYLAAHGIEPLFRTLTTELITRQPADPVAFLIRSLQEKKHTAVTLAAEAKEDAAAVRDASKDDDDDKDDDEDDEADYADFVAVPRTTDDAKRTSVMCKTHVAADFQPPSFAKTPDQVAFLSGVLRSIVFLRHLTRRELGVLVGAMRRVAFEAQTVVVREGDRRADLFYVVEAGSCDITVAGVGKVMEIPCAQQPSSSTKEAAAAQEAVLRRYFGELALLYDAPRAATVTATTPVTAWVLDRVTFKSILQDTDNKKIVLYASFIQSVPAFRELTIAQTHTLCNSLACKDYDPGATVITEGAIGDDFFIVEDGRADCFKRVDGTDTLVCEYARGDFFGELALQTDAPRAATVKARTPLSVLTIDRATFKRMIGNLRGLRKSYDA